MTEKDRTKFLLNKGQEISEGNCGVLNSSKKTNEIFSDFCPKGLKWVKSKRHFIMLNSIQKKSLF